MKSPTKHAAPHDGLIVAPGFHFGLHRLLDGKLPGPGSGHGHRPSEWILPAVLMLQGGARKIADIDVIRRERVLRRAGPCSSRLAQHRNCT